MANWKYHLRVAEDRRAFQRNEITIQELGKRFAFKIKKLECYGKDESRFSCEAELEFCASEFEHVIDVEDFDDILYSLYEWADTALDDKWPRTKMCWIEPA